MNCFFYHWAHVKQCRPDEKGKKGFKDPIQLKCYLKCSRHVSGISQPVSTQFSIVNKGFPYFIEEIDFILLHSSYLFKSYAITSKIHNPFGNEEQSSMSL